MEQGEYLRTQEHITMIAGVVKDIDLDLEGFLEAIHKTDSMAPIFDPTSYHYASKNLDIIRGMAKGLLEFQKSIPSLEKALEAENLASKHPTFKR